MSFSGRTVPDIRNSLLIVVDVQQGFVSQHSVAALPVIRRVLLAWQAAGGLTLMTQFVNSPESPYVRMIGWSALMPGDPAVNFDPSVADLSRAATILVEKSKYTALTPEALKLLADHAIHDICIIGLDTESCVLATALSAFESGFTPWIIVDAVASHAGRREHEAGLLVAGRYIGSRQLLTSDDLLLGDSSVVPEPSNE